LILTAAAAKEFSEEASILTAEEVVISATRTILIMGGIRAEY
jgi:hypothetical protein